MDITPLITKERQVLQAYGDGGFKVSGEQHNGSIILFPDQLSPWVTADISIESLAAITERAAEVDILLIGTGKSFQMVPQALRAHFRALGVTVEAMYTGAACRTYIVLICEERRVCAALLAV